jgi:hypothetical protein
MASEVTNRNLKIKASKKTLMYRSKPLFGSPLGYGFRHFPGLWPFCLLAEAKEPGGFRNR